MSFWKNLFGASKKETQIMEEPEHDLRVAPPDDLMIVKDEEESNISEDKKENLDNRDSP
ncbi:MAG: hypothetical protein HOE19_00610 [Candidatus Komeilibacteria bacterium]|mgnify:FL=1|jgi:hypothetical protein|nr:hypothetical protein [Candidatus Komeilibacteria bacterium]MBT4447369.1 hypothetical protein [Candidatus Komeilibacteria bacterium]